MDPIYQPLEDNEGSSQNMALELMQQSEMLDANQVNAVYAEKIRHKPLLLIPSMANKGSQASSRDESSSSKKKQKGRLSHAERRRLGLTQIPKKMDYQKLLQLHKLWLGYVQEAFTKAYGEALLTKLLKAEYQGAILRVQRSKCPSKVGIEGICVLETKNTFVLVTEENRVLRISKHDCIFELGFELDGKKHLFELHSRQVVNRPADRSSKRYKILGSLDL
ncbi:RNase P and RNase MRP subunit [Schizosaccharomyces japonicus yFS275]|uniref:RNase P and RNase MRP subunit n=1 Tax=Schizosaccharomyces japonicus (strain yFS275 / FY16936) TaxID=402676 RepID=B6JYG1_SCHJY|nr:RNase P and RNase MRP subunit [Schizosaccharomyces japonicus yFS275]EEB06579.1 RNase P and RNase MRP subunit [Schizosaccharomyces japonicus yFS275]